MPTGDPDLDEFRRLQEEEYGQWVATQNIYVGNALAYLEGGQVPASNVERHSYDKMGLVEPRAAYLKRLEKDSDEGRSDEDVIAESARSSAEEAQVSDAPQSDDASNRKATKKTANRKSTTDGD